MILIMTLFNFDPSTPPKTTAAIEYHIQYFFHGILNDVVPSFIFACIVQSKHGSLPLWRSWCTAATHLGANEGQLSFIYPTLCPHQYWWQETTGADPSCFSWQVKSPRQCSLQRFHHGQSEILNNNSHSDPASLLASSFRWTLGALAAISERSSYTRCLITSTTGRSRLHRGLRWIGNRESRWTSVVKAGFHPCVGGVAPGQWGSNYGCDNMISFPLQNLSQGSLFGI